MSTSGPIDELAPRDWEVDVASFVRFLNGQPGWGASPRQAQLMLDLILQLASHGELQDQNELGKWLAPIFCKTAQQQAEFPEVYRRWVHRYDGIVPAPESDKPESPGPKKPINYHQRSIQGVALGSAGLVLTAMLVLMSEPEMVPQKDDEVAIQKKVDNNTPVVAERNFVPQIEPTSDLELHRPGSRAEVRKLATIPSLNAQHWPWWLWIAFPVGSLLLWRIYRWLSEQAVLKRIRTQEDLQEDQFRLPKDDVDFLPSLNMGETARGLRVKEQIPSSKLDVDATIRRSMSHPESFEPVCLAEVEREYLFLIDRTYLGDHQTELARTLRQHLIDFGVGIDSYTFRSDPTYCTREREHSEAEFDDVRLNVLLDRHPQHRIVLFCTTEVFFDGLTGKRKPWMNLLADREDKVLLTPEPNKEWGLREIITERQGYRLLPMTAEGMALFRDTFADRRQEELQDWDRKDASHEDILESDRWLERGEPSQPATQRLMNELRRQIGEPGMLWLGAIAVYPQLHWGLTLRLGANLLSTEEFEQLLPRISHLIWFRHAFMPDWLRERLIAYLQRTDPALEMRVRDLLMQILRDVEEAEEDYELPLRIQLNQQQELPTRIRTWANQFRRIARKARLFKNEESSYSSNPYSDVVFLKFVSRPRLGALTLSIPDSLLRLFYPKGLAVYGFRTSTLVSSITLIALLAYLQFGYASKAQVIGHFQFSPSAGIVYSNTETERTFIKSVVPVDPNPGDIRFDNALGMKLVWCPPGKFVMGSPPDEEGHDDNEEQVEVTISHGFWMGQTEVTQAQWIAVMGTKPWEIGLVAAGPEYPATIINWQEASVFCERLTKVEQDAGRLPLDWRYHLPTEAQWEYACRAGTKTRYSFGDREEELREYAIYSHSNRNDPFEVGQKLPNPWGIFDMHGNAYEWCYDVHTHDLPGGIDPVVTTSPSSCRVVRGGSWIDGAGWLRSAYRFCNGPGDRYSFLGFRCMSSPVKSSGAGNGGSEGGSGARPEVPQ